MDIYICGHELHIRLFGSFWKSFVIFSTKVLHIFYFTCKHLTVFISIVKDT